MIHRLRRLGAYHDAAEVMLRERPDRVIGAMPDRRDNLPVSALLAGRVPGMRVEDGTVAYKRFMHFIRSASGSERGRSGSSSSARCGSSSAAPTASGRVTAKAV